MWFKCGTDRVTCQDPSRGWGPDRVTGRLADGQGPAGVTDSMPEAWHTGHPLSSFPAEAGAPDEHAHHARA